MSENLQSIEEVNDERENHVIHMTVIKYTPQWVGTGIQSPDGGELLELQPQPPGINQSRKMRIKCSKTQRTGYLLLDGSIREIITGIEWDKEVKEP